MAASPVFDRSVCFSPPTSREAWEARRNLLKYAHPPSAETIRLGGSACGDLLGVGFGSFLKQYNEYAAIIDGAPIPVSPLNEAMLKGTHCEQFAPFLLHHLAEGRQYYVTHDITRPFGNDYLVSVDGILRCRNTDRELAIFEVKTKAFATQREFRAMCSAYESGIPPNYMPQLELYCRAYDLEEALLFVITPADYPHLFNRPFPYWAQGEDPVAIAKATTTVVWYKRSDAVWQRIKDAVASMRYHLSTRIPPPARPGGNAQSRLNDLHHAYWSEHGRATDAGALDRTDSAAGGFAAHEEGASGDGHSDVQRVCEASADGADDGHASQPGGIGE